MRVQFVNGILEVPGYRPLEVHEVDQLEAHWRDQFKHKPWRWPRLTFMVRRLRQGDTFKEAHDQYGVYVALLLGGLLGVGVTSFVVFVVGLLLGWNPGGNSVIERGLNDVWSFVVIIWLLTTFVRWLVKGVRSLVAKVKQRRAA